MEKYIIKVMFSYHGDPGDTGYSGQELTQGIYDTHEDAVILGNELIKKVEKRFVRRGSIAANYYTTDNTRFDKDVNNFKGKEVVRAKFEYVGAPVDVSISLSTIKYHNINGVVSTILNSVNEHQNYLKDLT